VSGVAVSLSLAITYFGLVVALGTLLALPLVCPRRAAARRDRDGVSTHRPGARVDRSLLHA
jgi:hypothetical protein